MSQENEIRQLKEEIEELRNHVNQLSGQIEILKDQKSRPQLSSGVVGQIGGILLGAIVLIGIFWK